MNRYQTLFWGLGIYQKTSLLSLLWEPNSSVRWKGFNIQRYPLLVHFVLFHWGMEAVGMFAPRRQASSGLGQLYASWSPALGFGRGKCSVIREGGRERESKGVNEAFSSSLFWEPLNLPQFIYRLEEVK